jgi:uncharacterized membrane protein
LTPGPFPRHESEGRAASKQERNNNMTPEEQLNKLLRLLDVLKWDILKIEDDLHEIRKRLTAIEENLNY